MAFLEQLVFGFPPDRDGGREVLARSAGLSGEAADEVVGLCTRWGVAPTEGLRRPVLLSFPLESAIPALGAAAGDAYAVISVAQGTRSICHAVVLTWTDYERWRGSPYELAATGVFLGQWRPGDALERRCLDPGDSCCTVTPPMGEGDVGFVDEAVRQMLANERLLLPLERASSDSDRFLALVIAALPHGVRRRLRFASWAPGGANRYGLAATHRENAPFASWQAFLATSVHAALDDPADRYLDLVRDSLRGGDVAGLWRVSRQTVVATDGGTVAVDRPGAHVAPAGQAPATPAREPAAAAPPPTRPRPSSGGPVAATTPSRHPSTPPPRPSAPRRRRRRRSGGARRGFAVLLSLAILGAGGYYLWTAGHWTRLPAFAGAGLNLRTAPDAGVVDIGAIYAAALRGVGHGSAGGSGYLDDTARDRGLVLLQQGADLLGKQGQGFLDETERTLVGAAAGGLAPAPPGRLHERGRTLAREMRRLALARYSLESGVDWHDLADLDARGVEARLDSLMLRRRETAALEPHLADVDGLLRRVDVRARQMRGLAAAERLLAATAWDDAWNAACADAVDDLGGVRHGHARRVRDDAELLLRLKRAEHHTDQADRAYAQSYRAEDWLSPAVGDILPALRRRVGDVSAGPPASLLRSTAELYADMQAALEAGVTAPERATLLDGIARSRALAFDAALYEPHLARQRFAMLEDLFAAGVPVDSLPQACFAGEHPADHLRMLDAVGDAGTCDDPARWRALAATLDDPFLKRWAIFRADRAGMARSRVAADFGAELDALLADCRTMDRLAGAGGRCGSLWLEASARARNIRQRYGDAQAAGLLDAAAWSRLVAVHDALAAPPVLRLAGVSVRVAPDAKVSGDAVVVELAWADHPPRRSAPVRVLDAATGAELVTAESRWLSGWEPGDLASLDLGDGVRVTWRLGRPYWETVAAAPGR
jgi:hypothetical protein